MKLRYIKTFVYIEDECSFDISVNGKCAFIMHDDIIGINHASAGIVRIDEQKIIYETSMVYQGQSYKVDYYEHKNGHIHIKFRIINDDYVIDIFECAVYRDGLFCYIESTITAGIQFRAYDYYIKCTNGRLKSYHIQTI